MDQNQTNPLPTIFTPSRRKTLVTILIEVGQVSLASIAVPVFFNVYDPLLALLGFGAAIAFWCVALVLSK